MAGREEREHEAELKALFWRRMMYVGVLIVVVAVGIWFVRWISDGVGLGKIGDHYKQAEQGGP
jgi:hypothetical protein